MKRALLAVLLLLSGSAQAQELHLLSLDEFSMDYYRLGNNRDSYMDYRDPQDNSEERERWFGGASANFNLDLVKYGNWGIYHNNRVYGNATNAQFREVAWNYELGAQLGPKLQVWWEHLSRHVLDADRDDRFPLTNKYGISYVFYKRAE